MLFSQHTVWNVFYTLRVRQEGIRKKKHFLIIISHKLKLNLVKGLVVIGLGRKGQCELRITQIKNIYVLMFLIFKFQMKSWYILGGLELTGTRILLRVLIRRVIDANCTQSHSLEFYSVICLNGGCSYKTYYSFLSNFCMNFKRFKILPGVMEFSLSLILCFMIEYIVFRPSLTYIFERWKKRFLRLQNISFCHAKATMQMSPFGTAPSRASGWLNGRHRIKYVFNLLKLLI